MGAAPMPQAPTAAPVAMPQQMDMQQPMAQPIPAPQAMPPAVENTPAAAPIAMPPADPVAQQAPAPQQSFSMQTINNTIPNSEVRIESLLEECVRTKASDLHIQVGLPPILRIDGALQPVSGYGDLDEGTVERLVFATLEEDQKQILIKDKEFD